MDLFSLDLTPAEFMGMHFIMRMGGRVTGAEVAEALGVSPTTGKRVINDLIERGLLVRTGRGRLVVVLDPEGPPTDLEGPLVDLSKLPTSSTTTNYVLVEETNVSSTRGLTPPLRGYREEKFPLADLPLGKLTNDPPSGPADDLTEGPRRPKPSSKKPSKFHRIDDPPETWTVSHVVKEFQIRAIQAFPKSLYPTDGKHLSVSLYTAQRDHGVTVQQMLLAMDLFFLNEAQKVPSNFQPSRYYLKYLDTYLRREVEEVAVDPSASEVTYNTAFGG